MGGTDFEASWKFAADQLPQELKNEWCRFLDTNPSMPTLVDWCSIKAIEIRWRYFDLSTALIIGVRNPHPELSGAKGCDEECEVCEECVRVQQLADKAFGRDKVRQ